MFDNTHSYLRGKTVKYQIAVVEPLTAKVETVPEAAEKATENTREARKKKKKKSKKGKKSKGEKKEGGTAWSLFWCEFCCDCVICLVISLPLHVTLTVRRYNPRAQIISGKCRIELFFFFF